MSFKNKCCRTLLGILTHRTGWEVECDCGNHFISTGDAWLNVLELGVAKVEKYRRIRKVNEWIDRHDAPHPTDLF